MLYVKNNYFDLLIVFEFENRFLVQNSPPMKIAIISKVMYKKNCIEM